jgi:glycosyltransferase involved in cell wall biosynthesis
VATIDVLLPVKNGIDFLAASLDSICAQTFKDWRLLVLDHGSTDGSLELAEDYHRRDPRIQVHSFPDAVGLAGLLNRGLDISDCKYVMRHDADDVCFVDRMEIVLAAFKRQPDCIAISGQSEVIDGTGAVSGNIKMPIGRQRVAAASFFRNPITHPAAMLDFSAVQKLGVRYGVDFLNVLPADKRMEVNALAEDYFMFGQLAILGKCTNVPAQLIQYRWHGSNVSATRFREQVEVSLAISRYLARSFSNMHGLPYFDPAPFCNHGGILFDVAGQTDFSDAFEQMAYTLRRGLGASEELERELAFRKMASTRQATRLLWRYFRFQSRNAPETGEWNAIRSWLIRHFPGKPQMSVARELNAEMHVRAGAGLAL